MNSFGLQWLFLKNIASLSDNKMKIQVDIPKDCPKEDLPENLKIILNKARFILQRARKDCAVLAFYL